MIKDTQRRNTNNVQKGSIKSGQRKCIKAAKHVQRGSIKSVKSDSIKTTPSGSNKPVGSGSTDCSVQGMAQMHKLFRYKFKEAKLANAGHDYIECKYAIAGTKAAAEVKVSTEIEAATKLDTTAERGAAYLTEKFAWHLGRPPNTHFGVIYQGHSHASNQGSNASTRVTQDTTIQPSRVTVWQNDQDNYLGT